MRGIKVGNILMYHKHTVCIVSEIIKGGIHPVIIGIDSNNVRYKGTPEHWDTVIHKQEKLKHFEDTIFNNILSSR